MRKLLMLGSVLTLACGSSGGVPTQQEQLDEALPAMGPIIPDDGSSVPFNDQFGIPDPVPGATEKTVTPVTFGFAVDTISVLQTPNDPEAHCNVFNRTCDNRLHGEPDDMYYGGSLADVANSVVGRCGATVDGAQFAGMACITRAADIKDLTWNFDEESCTNSGQVYYDLINDAARQAFAVIESKTNWRFFETHLKDHEQGDPNVIIRCHGAAGSSLAVGYPSGELRLQYAVGSATTAFCESPQDFWHFENSFTDMMYSYRKSTIGLNWFPLWRWVIGCGSDINRVRDSLASIILHEFGHGMGLVHAEGPVQGRVGHWMTTSRSCEWAHSAVHTSNPEYEQAYDAIEHDNSKPLELLNTGIACLHPVNTHGGSDL